MKNRKLVLVFALLIICSFLCGCNACKKGWFADEHEFLYQKMSEIPVEDDTYYLDNKIEGSVVNLDNIQKELVFQGEKIVITPVSIEDGIYTIFNIKYKNYDLTLNIKFMEDRSDAYVKIHNIWKEKIKNYNSKSEIVQFIVFDGKFFIITCGLDFGLAGSVKGEIPYCLYYYDFDTDVIKYCGFFSGDYDEEFGSYYGFIRHQGFSICIK